LPKVVVSTKEEEDGHGAESLPSRIKPTERTAQSRAAAKKEISHMQFGVHCSLGVGFNPTAEDYVRVAQRAEELGYHSLWLADHLIIPEKIAAPYPWTEDGSVGFPRRTPFPDPFILLSYIAAKTQKILLGTSVLIVPYRNPLHVAKAVATVDMVSGGRFLFGVGVGWLKEEFDALGENFSERGKRTREYIQIMKALWQGGTSQLRGKLLPLRGSVRHPNPSAKAAPAYHLRGREFCRSKTGS